MTIIWIRKGHRLTRMLCQLCQCEESHNFHHFIPRTLYSNKWFKKRWTREEMRKGIAVCESCHRTIHDLVPDEKRLGRDYNTLEKLLGHPEIGTFVRWKRQRGRLDGSS